VLFFCTVRCVRRRAGAERCAGATPLIVETTERRGFVAGHAVHLALDADAMLPLDR